ncbi:hypothetical protein ACFV0R_29080 [Streptomyces sp. NPDC059578]|uniref:hypothetical protein n=1 Tax=unclassified Streptomyces TaxID=2593676 RepID=UPI00365F0A76
MLRSVLATFSVVVAAGALGATTAHADTGWGPVAPAKGGPVISKPADTGWGTFAPADTGWGTFVPTKGGPVISKPADTGWGS